MKFSTIILSAAALVVMSCGSKESGWSLVWADEFNDGVNFDEASWSKIPRGKADWNNYMSDYDPLYEVRDGKMILRGVVNDGKVPEDTARYLTGGIYTLGKRSFDHGRLEIRAKLNPATGAWPAIWLMPADAQYVWPDCGEIDIMERLNYDSIVYQTVHSAYTYTLNIKDNPIPGSTAPIDPDDFNTYSVELYRDSLVFFVNDARTFAYPRIETDKEGQFPFDRQWHLKIDMQLGGNWVGSVNPEELPVEMEVDWVRFYQKK